MPRKLVIYRFGRLNLVFPHGDKRDYVLASLRADAIADYYAYQWGIFDIEEIDVPTVNLVAGDLIKFQSLTDEEVIDVRTHRVSQAQVSNKVVSKSPFLLDIESGLIAFHSNESGVTMHQFRECFCRVFMAANENLMCDAEIQMIPDQAEMFECLRRLRTLSSIKVKLHPSNPHSRPVWQPIDDDIHAMNAEWHKREYGSRRRDMKVPTEGEPAYAALQMASSLRIKSES